MTTFRVTQGMMTTSSLAGLQNGLSRLASLQEHLSTGRVLNRPSDSPTDTTAAMRMRSSIADRQQYARNAADGKAWLGMTDATLSSMTDQLRRARELTLQGASTGAQGPAARAALATEVEQIREGLLQAANTRYLGRPVFGGITAGDRAYDATGAYVGTPGAVTRTVGEGVRLRVDVDAAAVFGTTGATVFDDLDAVATALRAGDEPGIQAGLAALEVGLRRMTTAQTEVGTRYARIEHAQVQAGDDELNLSSRLAEVESTDLAKAVVELQLQEVAYQAALGATARVMQPSLLDFLR